MVKFKFWVPAKGWAAGGYTNTHYAENEKKAREIVAGWNNDRNGEDAVIITEITPVTPKEFAEDYCGVA